MENRKNKIILIVLILSLLVQVFNTGSLYYFFSNLQEPFKLIGSIFIGLSAEVGIFICIYAGSKTAGKFFAILSFFVGIIFHSNFYQLENINFWTEKVFIASILMQIINSSLVWFLSELYVNRIERENKIESINNLKIQEKEIILLSEQLKEKYKKLHYEFLRDIDLKEQKKTELNLLEQKKTDLEMDIKRLNKVKAGKSKNLIEML